MEETTPVKSKEAICVICGESLSPTIPGTKCDCGRMYHTACLLDKGRCPVCLKSYFLREEKGKVNA